MLVHDVPNCGYSITDKDEKIFYATDTGTLEHIKARNYDFYLIEGNHKKSEMEQRIQEKVQNGKYYIKEIKAPTDYELSNKILKVEINDKGIFVDDKQMEEKNDTIEFTFENKKIEVPKTGDNSKIKLFA